jgi:Arc/MetJ-type ribon-helix-helix transcriptional regulator
MKATKTRLTVDLPRELVERADTVVEQGAARSRNQLITQALEAYLHSLEEAEIDARFEAMAQDEPYQRLALELTQEFERSDWEALQLGEGQE